METSNHAEWVVIGSAGSAEVLDYGLWIDGELFSEKTELEGTTHA